MQTAEDVQRDVLAWIAMYLSWLRPGSSSIFDNPWSTRLLHPYVCQRGLVFEIGTLSTQDMFGLPITHTVNSVVVWYTSCKFHRRARNGRFMGCHCHPVSRPDLLAAYRLGGIDAIGSKAYTREVYVGDTAIMRTRHTQKPLYKSQFHDFLWQEWHGKVRRLATAAGLDGNS